MSIKTICKMMATMALTGRITVSDAATLLVDSGSAVVDYAMERAEDADVYSKDFIRDTEEDEDEFGSPEVTRTHTEVNEEREIDYEEITDELESGEYQKYEKSPESAEKSKKTS